MDKDRLFFARLVGTGSHTLEDALVHSEPVCKFIEINVGSRTYGDKVGVTAPLSATGCILFSGHNLLGLPETIGEYPKYFTLLRDPRQRIISDYFLNRWQNFKETINMAMEGFEKFIDETPHLNFYIHHLGPLGYLNKQYFDIGECSIVPNDIADGAARMRIKNNFWHVGITERFDTEYGYLCGRLEKIPVDLDQFRTYHTPRPNFRDLAPRVRETIGKKVWYDLRLYDDVASGRLECNLRQRMFDFSRYWKNHNPIRPVNLVRPDETNCYPTSIGEGL